MTKIEWCDEVWNPIVGCSHVSEGCDHCYAERIATRFDYGGWDGMASFHADRMAKPRKWIKPRRIFVNSMGDLFHSSVPFEWLENVWNEMAEHPRHTFLVLTKRPARMLEFITYKARPILGHIWMGVTAENQARWDERVPVLLKCPAIIRFVSVEPMLGPVLLPITDRPDWVICGAETGQGKRLMDGRWYTNLVDQCADLCIPCFGKKDSNGYPLGPRNFPGHAGDRAVSEV